MSRPQPAQSGRAADPVHPNVAATATLEMPMARWACASFVTGRFGRRPSG
jgi:hypothetical protein